MSCACHSSAACGAQLSPRMRACGCGRSRTASVVDVSTTVAATRPWSTRRNVRRPSQQPVATDNPSAKTRRFRPAPASAYRGVASPGPGSRQQAVPCGRRVPGVGRDGDAVARVGPDRCSIQLWCPDPTELPWLSDATGARSVSRRLVRHEHPRPLLQYQDVDQQAQQRELG
jgi:hypothetical protein